jgi:DNA-binding XRE family transcriptional regulator
MKHDTTELKQHCESPGISLLSPGALLKQARHDVGYTQAEVARRLCLSVNIIISIERDDYKDLPGLSYIRGYLRAYANLVDYSADKVLKAFEQQGFANNSEQKDQIPKHPASSLAIEKEHIARVMSYILIVAFVALSFFWWNSHRNDSQKLLGEIRMDIAELNNHQSAIEKSNNDFKPEIKLQNKPGNNVELNSNEVFGKPVQLNSQ